jgi:hypothetical protein
MRVDRRELAAIFGGGALGALARLGLVEALAPASGEWPWTGPGIARGGLWLADPGVR